MSGKVFISHSTKDKEIADTIRQHLESAGLDCWIAPRDIEPGTDWTEGIMHGIVSSQIFVLVFSTHSNDSEHVRREVGQAFSLRLPVIPFRTDGVEARHGLRYFLDSVQWLDATKPPLERYLPVLTERGRALLNGEQSSLVRPVPGKEPRPAGYSAARQRKRWLPLISAIGVAAAIAVGVWFLAVASRKTNEANPIPVAAAVPAKSIAILPFESLSADKENVYFADGVQDEILNNVAKIAQLTVISRTSVMQYRAGEKRDLRQIANALRVANVLEGTVQRNANRVRINTELIDARSDKTIWADSYDRDLTDIFGIQSEVAQTVAAKLAATLSPDEKRNIERKPTENIEAYDLYLKAKRLLTIVGSTYDSGDVSKPLGDAVDLLEQAVRLDPKFALAYCAGVEAHDFLYVLVDPSPQQLALGDGALNRALELEPDLPEVHLAYAFHLFRGYRDYERARVQLAIARRGLPNDAEAMSLEASMDRRQGQFGKAIQAFKDAVARDPENSDFVERLAFTLQQSRQFREAEKMFDRLVELVPDEPILKTRKPLSHYLETGDDSAVRAAIAAFPPSLADNKDALCFRLDFACFARDWPQAKEIIEKLKGGDDEGDFAYAQTSVPIGCYSILIARSQGDLPGANASFAETRDQLNQKVQKSPQTAPLLSQLAVVDALLNNKEIAIAEARRAVEMLPTSKDAMVGPCLELNLAVVYAWTNQLDLAFEKLSSLTKVANGILYGQLKCDPLWDPLRQDPRFEKLLAELAPHS